MEKHILDKVILRNLFWFIVLPYKLEQHLESKAEKKSWFVKWSEKSGNVLKLELHDKTYFKAKEEAKYFGWTKKRFWQYWRDEDYFYSY